MKASILVVEDNQDLLYNLNIILEANGYTPILALNGKEALKALKSLEEPPDIIISDIMMPKMDGYEFFKEVSQNPNWYQIPFIFLSARASPIDIRLGKLLGADDYIVKPFEEKDLLAVITGKLSRINRINNLNKKLENLFLEPLKPEDIENFHTNHNLCILFAHWDDKRGPKLIERFPEEEEYPIPLEDVTVQLFSAATSIYGYDQFSKAEGLLINIKNLNMFGYLFFDYYPKDDERYGQKQYMLAILAPKINYFHSLKIKEVLEEISAIIKQKVRWDKEIYWNKIKNIVYEDNVLFD